MRKLEFASAISTALGGGAREIGSLLLALGHNSDAVSKWVNKLAVKEAHEKMDARLPKGGIFK